MIIEKLKEGANLSVEIINTQGTETISVYGKNSNNNSVDLDIAIRLKATESNWMLYKVQRDQEFLISMFSEETLAKLALTLYVSRHFSSKETDPIVEKLRTLESDLDAADEFIANEIGREYYSFFENKLSCINLKRRELDRYDIYYLSPTGDVAMISENRKLPNAFVVVYNFSFILKQFKEVIYPELIAYNLSPNQLELLKRIYLKK
ncbi:hypothetical protein HCJ57_09950 [Listeria booriae]|uniref:hypothetical protein n=1 Tax=Listeria booriae TaxID=1552123 RepID=UPI00162A8C67|nr:hypothetical protein [Listeria booriae]MBC1896516.1 hypothetical protein [Listeria booriae]MBC2056832.1 hypothetical protein [Listeria booriae]MBC2067636.1 hypothetical protein [Listeria booriae]